MLNGEFLKIVIQNMPNFVGLVFLGVVLFIVNNQTGERLDRQFDVLVACLSTPR
jgi:hypothetical protein